MEIVVSRRVWHGFASVNCCGTGLILSRNTESSLCGETLSHKKNWTSGRPKSCTRWPSYKLVRFYQLNYESVSWYLPVPSSDFLHVIVVDGIGEHHGHDGAHNGGTGKHAEMSMRSPPGAILKTVTIWLVYSTRCVPKRQPKDSSSRPSPSSSWSRQFRTGDNRSPVLQAKAGLLGAVARLTQETALRGSGLTDNGHEFVRGSSCNSKPRLLDLR